MMQVGLRFCSLGGAAALLTTNMRTSTALSEENLQDPFACAETVCQSKSHMLQEAMKAHGSRAPPSGVGHHTKRETIIDNSIIADNGCPVNKDELGHHTWAMLHTLGAYFPNEPTVEQQSYASVLLLTLSKLYPCLVCAADFEAYVEEHPPSTRSREALSVWICGLHNNVNEKLGKPLMSCKIGTLDERWRYGTPACRASIVDESNDE